MDLAVRAYVIAYVACPRPPPETKHQILCVVVFGAPQHTQTLIGEHSLPISDLHSLQGFWFWLLTALNNLLGYKATAKRAQV